MSPVYFFILSYSYINCFLPDFHDSCTEKLCFSCRLTMSKIIVICFVFSTLPVHKCSSCNTGGWRH